ncbi:DUF423 domain-containing protein [Metabacillus fastidiosus]|uniref:DUF423 domain-containing protein n=1 Tax=Metabacillus fastidiosus TaxID=1458 RepID=A0ABU6P455_9BACI|nr:DUF423 domain-containing protein [Metabacillus fastidiosus]MED4403828.1 DUF423 domain-containing protein [Metabacillus fastidiosus]MED4464372.1 DUF423 domain-containing protein [Metabacillus fastidiosus]
MKLFLIFGAVHALLAVALGAFGAHGLEGKLSEKYIKIWEKAVTYQMFHAVGLFVTAFLLSKFPQIGMISTAGWLFFIGILLFSGSLYILSVTQIGVLGAITPLGGVAFLAGWALIAIAAIKHL